VNARGWLALAGGLVAGALLTALVLGTPLSARVGLSACPVPGPAAGR